MFHLPWRIEAIIWKLEVCMICREHDYCARSLRFGHFSIFSQAVAPGMVKRRNGRIVVVGSITAFLASPFNGAYAVSLSAAPPLFTFVNLTVSHEPVKAKMLMQGSALRPSHLVSMCTCMRSLNGEISSSRVLNFSRTV